MRKPPISLFGRAAKVAVFLHDARDAVPQFLEAAHVGASMLREGAQLLERVAAKVSDLSGQKEPPIRKNVERVR